jgi:ribosomal protein L11 methyltransferase
MNYVELYIPTRDTLEAEIHIAELADWPFESFEQGETFLKAYIRADKLPSCKDELDGYLRGPGVECRFTEIEQQNWNQLWESNFEPVDVDGRAVIRAPFHDEPATAEIDVVIMPKMSFGTGHHATTWLMTAGLLDLDVADQRGLDMGSGTGVLAIVAAKRGAAHVDAVDIDEWAFENCTENIGVNGVQNRVTPMLGNVSAVSGHDYDFILANINRNILLADMDSYVAAMHIGATLMMSGILEHDIPAITEKARALGLSPVGQRVKDGWAMVVCIKKSNPI